MEVTQYFKLIDMKLYLVLLVLFSSTNAQGDLNFNDVPQNIDIDPELYVDDVGLDQDYFPTITQVPGAQDDASHTCWRDCRGSAPRLCFYEFKVEYYSTMSKACYDCPNNSTDCSRPHCAAADGFERPIVTVNRRLPGPSIQVCEGDEIVVDVTNDLGSDATAIHWHGLHQKATPYMDGVPYLTQCPIPAGSSFRYHFLADLPGTHYWHSHAGFQRTDGMFGSLIIRSRNDSSQKYYDVDDPNHVFVITDWMDGLGIAKFVNHHHTQHDNKPYNVLVNGIGKDPRQRYLKSQRNRTPLYEIVVQKGKRYRLRSLSNSIQNCPVEISIDKHPLLIINTDAHEMEPIEVDNVVIYGGERWDFVINANQEIGTYWIKFRGLLDCDERFKSAYQLAVLRYEGAKGVPSSLETITYTDTIATGFQLNKLNDAPGDNETFMTSAEIKSRENKIPGIDRKPDHQFWMNFDFEPKNNEWFHHEKYYPFYGVPQENRLYVPQINDITLTFPKSPPLSQPEDVNQSVFCNSTKSESCKNSFCTCTHTLHVELGSLVEIILVDKGFVYWANHPFHIHGHAFAVIGMGRFGENTTVERVYHEEKMGKLNRNFNNPPIKDTVTVPDGGYTIIRFIADNPGYWLFHCHIAFHMEVGMGMIFHIGTQDQLPPKPDNFPRCGTWLPNKLPILNKDISNAVQEDIHISSLYTEAEKKNPLQVYDVDPYSPHHSKIERYAINEKNHPKSSNSNTVLSSVVLNIIVSYLLLYCV